MGNRNFRSGEKAKHIKSGRIVVLIRPAGGRKVVVKWLDTGVTEVVKLDKLEPIGDHHG